MKLWREWRERLRRAGTWEEASPADTDVRHAKALFAAARRSENPRADMELWRKLRVQIRAIEREGVAASMSGIMAAFGFRFVGAAACALALVMFLTWSAGPLSTTATTQRTVQLATLSEAPEEVMSGPLQAQSGDDLLQYVAYASAR